MKKQKTYAAIFDFLVKRWAYGPPYWIPGQARNDRKLGLHLFDDLDSEEVGQAVFDCFCGEVAEQ